MIKLLKNNVAYCLITSFLLFQIVVIAGCESAMGEKSARSESVEGSSPDSRSFEFKYGASIVDVPENATVRVWFPVAETNKQQTVDLANASTPSEMQVNRDGTFGNKIGFFEVSSSESEAIEFEMKFDVTRFEASSDGSESVLTEEQKKTFLSANRLVPLDGKPRELLKEKEIPAEANAASEVLYNVVEEHMSYDKSKPGYGNGDVVWACDSKTGNCTDFHSLFISLARSQKIPARFEIGFPLPNDKTEGEIGGYHCWAWFHAEDTGWSPVDISEADKHPELKGYYFGKLTADRISFSSGRDIELVPKSASGPLNYFVYPHVEVDGKVWPNEKIKLSFSFKDKQ